MNESELRQLLLRYEQKSRLTDDEKHELLRHLRNRPELVREIIDRRAIDGMLQLLAVDEAGHEQFINGCVSRLAEVASPEGLNPAATEFTSQDAPITVVTDIVERRRGSNKRQGRKWATSYLVLAVATSVLVFLGALAYLRMANEAVPNDVAANSKTTESPSPDSGSSQPLLSDDSPESSVTRLENSDKIEDRTLGKPAENLSSDAKDLLATNNQDRDDNAEMATSNDDLPEIPPVKSITISDNETNRRAETMLATVVNGNEARWDGELPSDRIGSRKLQLLEGSANIKFDSGVLIRLLAPAELEIKNSHSVVLSDGNFITEIPRTTDEFEIATRFAVFQNPANTRVQLIIDPTLGAEAFVSRGRINLVHPQIDSKKNSIELSRNGLSQTVVRPVNDRPKISSVTIARGKNEFMGQIGTGPDSLILNSPVVFANVLSRVEEQPNTIGANEEFANNWPQLVREMKALAGNANGQQFQELLEKFLGTQNLPNPNQKLRDVLGNGSTNFQGSLSINGVQRQFNSREEYEKVRQQLLNGSLLQGLPNVSAQDVRANEFRGELNLNGRPLKFSSPDVFQSLRKRMNR